MKTISVTGVIPQQDDYGFFPKLSLPSKQCFLFLLLLNVAGLAFGQNLRSIPIHHLPHSVVHASVGAHEEIELWLGDASAPLENVRFVRVLLELDSNGCDRRDIEFEYDPIWASNWFPGALKSFIELGEESILLEVDFGKHGPTWAKGKLGSIISAVQAPCSQGDSPLLRVSGLILVENVDALRTTGDWGATYDVWKNAFDLKF